MTLKDQMASDALNVFCNPNEVAEMIIHVAADGVETTVGAVINEEPNIVTTGTDGQYVEADATALVSMLEVGGISKPAIEDVVVYGDVVYAVTKVARNSCGCTALLTLKRKDIKRVSSRTNFRQ